jgi:hypothetical protein
MDIPVAISKHSYFSTYVEVLNPILKLKKREKELLVEYLKIAYKNKDYNELQLKSMFSNQDIKWDIRRVLGMSEPSFNNHIKQLRDKAVFINGLINPLVNAGLLGIDNNFNLNYKLMIKVDGQADKETDKTGSKGA